MKIRLDDFTNQKTIALINEHLQDMAEQSPPESMHALGIDALKKPDITFWSVWENEDIAACGALKQHSDTLGEIKSVRTASNHLRKGAARLLVEHMIQESKRRGLSRLNLESGSSQAFIPAHKLYRSLGFKECGSFADYKEDPNSLFMTLQLQQPFEKGGEKG